MAYAAQGGSPDAYGALSLKEAIQGFKRKKRIAAFIGIGETGSVPRKPVDGKDPTANGSSCRIGHRYVAKVADLTHPLLHSFDGVTDAFLAFPMARLTEKEYTSQRGEAQRVETYLKMYCGFQNVYNPGTYVPSSDDFEAPEISLCRALDAFKSCRLFVMLYTSDKPSSVLVEAGCALARGIPSVYFVRKPSTLPVLLKAAVATFEDVYIYEYEHIEEVLLFLKQQGEDLFTRMAKRSHIERGAVADEQNPL